MPGASNPERIRRSGQNRPVKVLNTPVPEGAADLKARAPLPPAPYCDFAGLITVSWGLEPLVWIPFLGAWSQKAVRRGSSEVFFEVLEALGALFFDLGGSFWAPWHSK